MRKLSEYLGKTYDPNRGYVEVYLSYSHHGCVPLEAPPGAFIWAEQNLLREALGSAVAELEFQHNKPGYKYATLYGHKLIPEALMPEDSIYVHPAVMVSLMRSAPPMVIGYTTLPGEKR